ncbi:MAG TPA: chemotaxis protein CheA [Fimbriimonadaceae bacterium]|nr:chemotaxis protein CheA [Fimbriimonadaceae bacterium]
MSQYLGVFLDEAQEQLELFENHVIGLERSTDPDGELQVLFRAAHTLKGSSKAMGFTAIGDLTHKMENVLDSLRGHEMQLTSEVIDVLLESLDMLKAIMATVAARGEEGEVDTAKLAQIVKDLEHFQQSGGTGDPPPAHEPGPAPATPQMAVGGGVTVRIRLSENCPMKGIRVTLILGTLQSLGSVLSTRPSLADLEEERFELEFDVVLETEKSRAQIEDALSQLLDVSSAEIVEGQSVEPVAPAATPAPTAASAQVAPAPVATSSAPASGAVASTTVRVDVGRLDKLLNLVGELVTDRTQLTTLVSAVKGRYSQDEQLDDLLEGINRFGQVTSELQEEVMKSRMLPINGVFQRMPRMVRDLAQKTGKDIDFEMFGGETELDRSVLEVLGDPLIHLLRNAVDHGVEMPEQRASAGKAPRGRVTLSARHERSQIAIEISDDGAGIDPAQMRATAVRKGVISESAAEALSDREAIQLVFAPGLTTSKEISEISGRGVGMDIVRSNIDRVGGRILIESKLGEGTRFLIYLPLTLAIVRAVLVESEGVTYAIPLTSVAEMLRLDRDSGDGRFCRTGGQAALLLRGKTLPLACLADVMRGSSAAVHPDRVAKNSHAVVVRHGEGQAALSVDALQGETEVVIKPLSSLLKDSPGVSGASILGDGRVALVIDPSKALEELHRSKVAA